MYRIIVRLMMHDVWNYIRKKKIYFVFYLLGAGFILMQLVQIILTENGGKKTFLEGKTGIIWAFIVAFVLLWPIVRGVPLRICKGVYVCPAGDKEKKNYLKVLTWNKVGIGMIVVFLVQFAFHGTNIFKKEPMFLTIALILSFFTFLNMSLNIGIGETGERKLDEKGYAVRTKAEEIIKIYWMCSLAIQWLFLWFQALAVKIVTLDIRIVGAVWFMFMAGNLFIALKYVGTFLGEIMLYEDVHCQRPQRYVVQYDI